MKKTEREKTPEIYKVIYRLKRWKTKSERYFTGFSVTEAFNDFHYAFVSGHVNSDRVTIHKIERYDRFADRWYDETSCIGGDHENVTVSRGKIILNR